MTSIDTSAAPRPWRRRAWAGRLFVAPNLAAVTVFLLFPLGFSLYMSFQQWDVFNPPKFVGLKNFRELFTSDPLFLIAIRNTAIFTLGTVAPTVLISLVVAGLLNQKVKGIGIVRTIVFLPLEMCIRDRYWGSRPRADGGRLADRFLGPGVDRPRVLPRWRATDRRSSCACLLYTSRCV